MASTNTYGTPAWWCRSQVNGNRHILALSTDRISSYDFHMSDQLSCVCAVVTFS